MNKTPRLSKSGIEYLDYSWGIWSGCRNLETGICHVKACWAKGLTTRYPKIYPDGFNPHYYPEALDSPKYLRKPSIISVGWVGDIIGYCDSNSIAAEDIVRTIKDCPQHRFLFLTKNPDRLIGWGEFPDNCWVGVTITNNYTLISDLAKVEAKVKYLSIEPLLNWADLAGQRKKLPEMLNHIGINWVIIGSQTKPYKPPEIEWVEEIVAAASKAKIPVFLKDNLNPLFAETTTIKDKWVFSKTNFMRGELYRQELPA